jgi:RNA polymerase sigma-70 factor, ECF subfamily
MPMNGADAGTAGFLRASRTQCRADLRRPDPDCQGDHIDRLYRAARGMCGSPEQAVDLVHVTLARAINRPSFLRSADDMGHLLRVLRNTYFSEERFAQHRSDFPVRLEGSPEGLELFRAIASLPESLRDVLIAVDLVGLSHGEATRALRVRKPALAARLHRGRQRLAEMLGAGSVVRPAMPRHRSGT